MVAHGIAMLGDAADTSSQAILVSINNATGYYGMTIIGTMTVFAASLFGKNDGPYKFNMLILVAWIVIFAIFDIRPKKMKERQDMK